MNVAFDFLLLPSFWAARNRARLRQKGDGLRATVFATLGLFVVCVLFGATFWLTWLMLGYDELGEHLVRMGLSWLFLTFLSFVAFSAIVTSLSAFFLSEDLRLLLAAPVPSARLFYSRFAKSTAQASWMVLAFLTPALLGIGLAHCAPWRFYVAVPLVVLPFVAIPSAIGTLLSLTLVNVFPARRVRDLLVLTGLVFAIGLVVLLRVLRPERLLTVDSIPDVTAFFGAMRTPVTPLLPSFWAGEAVFAALTARIDWLHLGALWTTAIALTLLARIAHDRHYFSGWSKSQEARKARFSRLGALDAILRVVPLPPAARSIVLKDVKLFFRDAGQWSQLLLIFALVVVYVYNFRVLDLDRIPYMAGVLKNVYAFVNMALAAFVLSAVAVRFVFPAISIEGSAFWILRKSPIRLRTVLWSKFAALLLPVLILVEAVTLASNHFLRVDAFLNVVSAAGLCLLSIALVALALGLGARYPRFGAENVAQIAGSYGAVVFMVQAVLLTIVHVALLGWAASRYLWHSYRHAAFAGRDIGLMAAIFGTVVLIDLAVFRHGMRMGEKALESLGD